MKIEIKYNNFEDIGYIVLNPNYLSMYSDEFGWICGYENGNLCYVLPFVVKKRYIFRYVQFQSNTIKLCNHEDKEKEFLNLLVKKLIEEKKFDFISQPKTNAVFTTFPDGAIISPFGTYIIDLSLDEEILWKSIHSKHKNVIKRAIKNNVIVLFGKDLFNDAYETIFKTLKRNSLSMIKKEKLLKLYETNSKNFLIGCSYLNNKPQSAVIILFDKIKGYYFWGGTNENLTLGANNLLHWEVIKKLKSLGVKYYDFVGARIEARDERLIGIQRFKKRFGATLKEGYLWKYPIKEWKYNLFYLLYKIRTKKGDIIDQENR